MQALLNAGADPLTVDNHQSTPLSLVAAFSGNPELASLLIDAGVDVNAKDLDGDTALHEAFRRNHVEVVRILIQAGARVDERCNCGRTPIFKASARGCADGVRLLLEAGANLKLSNDAGWTPLHAATAFAHPDVVSLLIGANAEINAVDGDGNTPLHFAMDRKEEVIEETINGETRSLKVLSQDRMRIADMLSQAGADVARETKWRRTEGPLKLRVCFIEGAAPESNEESNEESDEESN